MGVVVTVAAVVVAPPDLYLFALLFIEIAVAAVAAAVVAPPFVDGLFSLCPPLLLDNDDDDADSDIDSSSSCVVSFADEATATAAEGGAESINCARRRRAANNPCNTLSLLLDVVLLAVAWKAARCLAVVELILIYL